MEGRKNILVTGATGFIGRHLVSHLEDTGLHVLPFSRSRGHDVTDANAFTPFLRKNIDIVVHLAGLTFVPESWEKAESFYTVNTLGTQRVLDFCRATGSRIVYVSAYVYGVPKYLPIDESHPAAPNNPYAHSKWLGEELCRFYSRTMGVKATILRPFNLYGPGQDERFLIPLLLRQLREQGSISVRDLAPKRDYLHVADFAEACGLILGLEDDLALFNVGSGFSLSVSQLIDMLEVGSGSPVARTSLQEPRRNEIPETIADIAALRERLGWSPTRDMRSELIRMACNAPA